MGIDAEMFVRHRGRLTDIAVRQLAAAMCATIGVEKFFLQREAGFGGPHHAISILDSQDGYPVFSHYDAEPIIGDAGEQFLRVHLYTRYYGAGYERGDWLTIKATAEFLESRIIGASIWYGGDSSGVACQPFGPAEREKLHRHWLTYGHDPYVGAFTSFGDSPSPSCDFCGGRRLDECGGGQGIGFHHCGGCGQKVVSYQGKYFPLPKDVDFFKWREHVPAGGPKPCTH